MHCLYANTPTMKKEKPTYQELENELSKLKKEIEILKLSEKSDIISEDRHKALIANIGDVIGIMGSDGIMKYKSPNIERWFGWKPEDLVGTDGWETVHPEDIEAIQKEFFTLLEKDNASVTVEYRYKCKDGSFKWIELTAVNCINNSTINGVLLNYHDISEGKRVEEDLKESEYKHRILFENMQDVVCMLDNQGNIIDINEAGTKLFGFSKDEFLNMNVSELIYHGDKQDSDNYFKKLENNGFYNMYEGRIITKSGEIKWIQVSSTKFVKDGIKVGSQDIIRDITVRKEAEQKILQQNITLKELNDTKDKFFSIISHDLRSPFNSLLGLSKILNDNFDEFGVSEQKEFIGHINQTVNNTYKLLENLLLWSRSQSGVIEFNPEKENLNSLSNQTIELLSQLAFDKSITLKNEISKKILVNADKNMLLTILRNLVSNAIKFTPKGGKVIVKAKPIIGNNKHNFVEISVKDSGVGISHEKKAKLFIIAENVSTKGTENESGTGLGLILCKEFTEKHNGKIWVESEVGKGSLFNFTIPSV